MPKFFLGQIFPKEGISCLKQKKWKPPLHFANHVCRKANLVTENLKTLKILPFHRLYRNAWPKVRKLWVNQSNCERRKNAISIWFTTVNAITSLSVLASWSTHQQTTNHKGSLTKRWRKQQKFWKLVCPRI